MVKINITTYVNDHEAAIQILLNKCFLDEVFFQTAGEIQIYFEPYFFL